MSKALEALKERQENIEHELQALERQLYDQETAYYTSDLTVNGTVLKGFEGFLTAKTSAKNKHRTFKLEDRAFSLSSVTSPASQEALAEQEAARVEAASGRGGGGAYSAGYGKRRH